MTSRRSDVVLRELQMELGHLHAPYEAQRFISSGSYGAVCAALDTRVGKLVAIKRVYSTVADGRSVVILNDPFLSKRVVREVLLLSHFTGVPSILSLRDVFLNETQDKMYVVTDLMHSDLAQVIADTSITITPQHVRYFMFRILVGLHTLHSAGVVHRDLHPGNILISADNETRICDFNLAREDTSGSDKTHYVTHRWYRAPELVMQFKGFTKVVDLWSAGCIMAELFNRRALFRGSTFFNQLNKIIEVVGTPNDEDIQAYSSSSARSYLRSSLPNCQPRPWSSVVPSADPQALDLLSRLLQFDPRQRISAAEALRHPYFASLFNEDVLLDTLPHFHFDESVTDPAELRAMLSDVSRRIRHVTASEPPNAPSQPINASHLPRSSSMVSMDMM